MNASVSRVWFLAEPLAVQRRVIRAIGEHAGLALEFKHVEEIVYFAAESGDSGKQLSLPSGWKVLREAEDLVFVTPDLRAPAPPADYEYDLSIPGSIFVPETGSHFDALFVPANRQAGYNPEQLLDPDSIQGPLKVRNWRPGDRFWPPHTKSPKKIKELLQERRIPHPERRLWPAVAGSTEIIWLRGFPVPAQHRVKPERGALLLRERAAKAKDL